MLFGFLVLSFVSEMWRLSVSGCVLCAMAIHSILYKQSLANDFDASIRLTAGSTQKIEYNFLRGRVRNLERGASY